MLFVLGEQAVFAEHDHALLFTGTVVADPGGPRSRPCASHRSRYLAPRPVLRCDTRYLTPSSGSAMASSLSLFSTQSPKS